MFDVIIVGARCGGAPTAMLLARSGVKVVLLDRAAFPSDTLSTHILWPQGAEVMARWGLLSRLAATGVPPICKSMIFDVGPFALRGMVSYANDGKGGFCPRRTVLDHLLVNAAAEAGVEVREGVTVDALIVDNDTVVGVRGRGRGTTRVEERARVVVGADGVRSFVAQAVGAPEYETRPIAACGYYSYFSGVSQDDAELYVRDGYAFGAVPTHDGQHIVMVNWPARDFLRVREDVEGHVWRALDSSPDFAARVRAGRREDAWHGAPGVPGYFRKPYGKGWALVGDASYNRDPITAQGMSDAFIDAESLAAALTAALSGRGPLEEALAAHERTRNERVGPMYEFTTQLAALEPPPPHMRRLFAALRGNQDATNAFLSAITGSMPLPEFFATDNINRILSSGGAPTAAGRSIESTADRL